MSLHIDRIKALAKKCYSYFKRRGLVAFIKRATVELRMRFFPSNPDSDENVANFLKSQDLFLQSWEVTKHKRPEVLKFSIIVPLYKSNIQLLKILVDSIINQTYSNWELLLVDDGSLQLALTNFLHALSKSDKRIIILALKENQGISAATNLGLEEATGDFICLADHDDVVHVSTLSVFANELIGNPNIAWIYSDEAKISADSKRIYDLFFKPDWSPYYLMTCMYTAHFAAYRADLMKELKFRSQYDGAQDYDFVLRLSRKIEILKLSVLHVPFIFYFWRAIPGSTALSMSEKPNSSSKGLALLNEFAEEFEHIASFESTGYPGSYSAIPVEFNKPISIIIPSALKSVDGDFLLQNCITSIEESNPPLGSEIIVVISKEAVMPDLVSEIDILLIQDTEPNVNIARKMNIGADAAKHSVLAFINDDVLITRKHSLETLAGFLRDARIGTISPKLLYPNELVQCGGIALNKDNLPDHISRNSHRTDPGYYFALVGQREVTANTGAFMVVLRSNFQKVRGFNEMLPVNYNDIDLCLKLSQIGLSNLILNQLQAIHLESASRVPEVKKVEEIYFLESWANFEEVLYPKYLSTNPPNYAFAGFVPSKLSPRLTQEFKGDL